MPEESMGPGGLDTPKPQPGEATRPAEVDPQLAQDALLARQLVQGGGDALPAATLMSELAERGLTDAAAHEAVGYLVSTGQLEFVAASSVAAPSRPMQPYLRDEAGSNESYRPAVVSTTPLAGPSSLSRTTLTPAMYRIVYSQPSTGESASGQPEVEESGITSHEPDQSGNA